MKVKIAEIKLATLERDVEKTSLNYLHTIRALTLMLNSKSDKQNRLKGELAALKN